MRIATTAVLSLFLLLCAGSALANRRTVTVIHRADRVEIEGGWVTRIAGITAPEPGTPLGDEGLKFTRDRVLGKSVVFSTWTTNNLVSGIVYDGEGLPFATIEFGSSSIDLAVELLKVGLARVDAEYLPEYCQHYREIEGKARAAGIGLWAEGD